MNRIERAVIMAAGEGNRMHPLTRKVPKPLISVCGERMIDTVIRALRINGITEIYVVVGYRKEDFASLTREYPGLTLIENPDYHRANNISSLHAARAYLENAMILDADQIIHKPSVLSPSFERSGYNAVWVEEPTREWLMQTDEQGIVTSCSRTGGDRGWQLYSISRWSAQDGARLRELLELEYVQNGRRDIYWDDVAMFCHPDRFTLGIHPMKRSDVVEIDDLEELAAVDPSYIDYLRQARRGMPV